MNTPAPGAEPQHRRALALVSLPARISLDNLHVSKHTFGYGQNAAAYDASRSRCASGSASSFLSVWFSICRIRSRVTLNVRPTSSSV